MPHIKRIFNAVIQNRFLTNWTTSVPILLLKSGNINNPSNYCTRMINPLFGKLSGSMIEKRINVWFEKEGKRVKGKASFIPNNSTVDGIIYNFLFL